MVGLLWVVAAGVACGQQDGKGDQEPRPMQQKKIETVLKEHTDSLMAVPGVVGTAIGECAGKPCIKVYVEKKTPELLKQIPSTIDGYTVAKK
jgi:hypothetical protein